MILKNKYHYLLVLVAIHNELVKWTFWSVSSSIIAGTQLVTTNLSVSSNFPNCFSRQSSHPIWHLYYNVYIQLYIYSRNWNAIPARQDMCKYKIKLNFTKIQISSGGSADAIHELYLYISVFTCQLFAYDSTNQWENENCCYHSDLRASWCHDINFSRFKSYTQVLNLHIDYRPNILA